MIRLHGLGTIRRNNTEKVLLVALQVQSCLVTRMAAKGKLASSESANNSKVSISSTVINESDSQSGSKNTSKQKSKWKQKKKINYYLSKEDIQFLIANTRYSEQELRYFKVIFFNFFYLTLFSQRMAPKLPRRVPWRRSGQGSHHQDLRRDLPLWQLEGLRRPDFPDFRQRRRWHHRFQRIHACNGYDFLRNARGKAPLGIQGNFCVHNL